MHGLERWHSVVAAAVAGEEPVEELTALLHEDVTFHSPVLHRPVEGRDLTTMYLAGAMVVLANETFHYVREVVDGDEVVLEFVAEVDGLVVNGVDMITFDDDRIVDFKVMVRPRRAFDLVQRRMAELLAANGQ